jgi:hypothetical protein
MSKVLIKKRHLQKIGIYKKSAYDFKDGNPMTEHEIVKWMNQIYVQMVNDHSIDYSSRACGSSLVVAHKVVEDIKKPNEFDIEFYIVDGYKSLTLFCKEEGENFENCNDPDAENKPAIFFNTA